MQKHRITVDLKAGTLWPQTCPVVEVIAGELHYRDGLGGFRRVDSAHLHSGEQFIISALHDDEAAATAEALVELRRRGEWLLSLADKFEQQQEHDHA